jgi:hypothetical protein
MSEALEVRQLLQAIQIQVAGMAEDLEVQVMEQVQIATVVPVVEEPQI